MTDGLSTLYQDLLGGSYDCVDRIVLNAYFHMGMIRVASRVVASADRIGRDARKRVPGAHDWPLQPSHSRLRQSARPPSHRLLRSHSSLSTITSLTSH
jgi:hypothetical protein